jgi:hypothetical protein
MDTEKLYQDYSVPYETEGHKHTRPGWINTACPFCTGNPGIHLGYNTYDDYYKCWRCGWHPITKTIAKLLNINENNAISIVRQYGGSSHKVRSRSKKSKKEFKFPTGTGPLSNNHKQYLLSRGFDPDRLAHDWGLLGTNPTARLDESNYGNRVIAPILWDGTEVSFQGRAISDENKPKYKACPQEREMVPHQTILYGDQSSWNGVGICVEGITDVWRLGKAAFAVFGIEYTNRQVRWIATIFKRVPVVFDDDPQAVEQAKKLVAELRYRNLDSFLVPIKGDPGGMDQAEADYLTKQLLK